MILSEKYVLRKIFFFLLSCVAMHGCSIAYRLTGASIDYTRIKTIHIADIQNLAPTVYPPLAQKFSEELRTRFQTRTRLSLVNTAGDLTVEGEFTGYDLTAEAVQENALAAKTKLTVTLNIRFINKVSEKESFERQFTSYETFDSSLMFTDVQDELIARMTEDLINQIFNATVENW